MTYLTMLDDLARDPTGVSKYRSKESEHYQLFGSISYGSYWEVYIAWKDAYARVNISPNTLVQYRAHCEISTRRQYRMATLNTSKMRTT